jgi:hypothetical protein
MLSAPNRAVLDAVARRVVPQAFDGGPGSVDLIARIEDRLAHAPPIAFATSSVGSPCWAVEPQHCSLSGMVSPFPRLSADRQECDARAMGDVTPSRSRAPFFTA